MPEREGDGELEASAEEFEIDFDVRTLPVDVLMRVAQNYQLLEIGAVKFIDEKERHIANLIGRECINYLSSKGYDLPNVG